MPDPANPLPPDLERFRKELPDAHKAAMESFAADGEGHSEKLVDAIEMIGEESAAGFGGAHISPGMRYLHSSRTIHQLVTDRNRAVAIFLAVASLLLTASGAIYNAKPTGPLIVPIEEIQRWCLPVTFATLTVLALFMAFLLIRTRVGLIYEVAKMNALLGLPIGRVQRLSPLSIHFILQTLISCAGGASAAFLTIYLVRLNSPDEIQTAGWIGVIVSVVVTAALLAIYVVTVQITTADHRLQGKTAKEPRTK